VAAVGGVAVIAWLSDSTAAGRGQEGSVRSQADAQPRPEELEALLPANWIKAQESSSQTIEVEVA